MEHLIQADHTQSLVAELNNELIGCGYAGIDEAKHYLQHTRHACLGFMYVAPVHRGKGVNKLIMNKLFKFVIQNFKRNKARCVLRKYSCH